MFVEVAHWFSSEKRWVHNEITDLRGQEWLIFGMNKPIKLINSNKLSCMEMKCLILNTTHKNKRGWVEEGALPKIKSKEIRVLSK